MAFPCTVDSDTISVGSSGGNPQWSVNLAAAQSCVGGTATTPNILSTIAGQGLYVPGTKVWSVGDGGAALPYFEEVADGYERWPTGFTGSPLVKSSPDASYSTLKTAHYKFINPTCHPMKVQIICRSQLNIRRPKDVQIQAGMMTAFSAPNDFASGSTPGGLVPATSAGGIDYGILVGTGANTYLGLTSTFIDAPSIWIGPAATVHYYVELYVGINNWAASADDVTCDFWLLGLNAIGVEDVLT